MPISALQFSAALRFTLEKVVADWPDISQGENEFALDLNELDLDDWAQAYAAVHTLAASGTATIDLQSFTNLATESVVLTQVIALLVKVEETVTGVGGGILEIGPGASNPLTWFFGTATDSVFVKVGESMIHTGDSTFAGYNVDATHKTLDLANTGTQSLKATVIIIGSTTL